MEAKEKADADSSVARARLDAITAAVRSDTLHFAM